jgi:gluconolactonase
MVSKPEQVAEGMLFCEGPVWCNDGTLVVTSVPDATIWRIWPESRRREKVAQTNGGANGLAPAEDGYFLMTQNGGLDFHAIFGEGWPQTRFVTGGLELIHPEGYATRVLGGMAASNDLVVMPDNTVYFTNPPKFPYPKKSRDAKICSWNGDTGEVKDILIGMTYCNGIAREADGHLVATVDEGLLRVFPDSSYEWIARDLGQGKGTDGLCIDTDGRFYLAGALEHGIRVVEGNKQVDFLPLPGQGPATTNCCFGGPDHRWLFATDGMPGTVYVWTDLPAPGLPLYPWKVPAKLKQQPKGTLPSTLFRYEEDTFLDR